MLTIYRRHVPECSFFNKKNQRTARANQCEKKCPIWVQGSLAGEYVRRSLDMRSWRGASDLVHQWESSGQVGVVRADIPSISIAVAKFLEDAESRHLHWETLRKYRSLLEVRLLEWCEKKGYRQLKQIDVDALRQFRASWDDGALYATKNLERMRAFFRFCHQAGWMKSNPALAVKPPKSDSSPTLPFSADEMKKILKACDKYGGNKDRIRAFILVMRYSGLRIGDTIALKRESVQGNKIRLRTAKTGTPIYVPIPDEVVEALKTLPGQDEYYFWTGNGLRSAVGNWSRYLARIFELAKIKDAHSHRFRDTFSTSLLEKGVPVETVAMLLGNTPAIVLKHYRPWIRSLQANLERAVELTWA